MNPKLGLETESRFKVKIISCIHNLKTKISLYRAFHSTKLGLPLPVSLFLCNMGGLVNVMLGLCVETCAGATMFPGAWGPP